MESLLELAQLPVRSFSGGIGLLLVTVLILVLAQSVGRLRKGLRPIDHAWTR